MKIYNLVLITLLIQSLSLTAQFSEKVVVYSGESEAYEIYAVDINNDNLNDLIGCTENELILFVNQGNHIYADIILESNPGAAFFSVHAADFNNDGLIDIVSCTEGDGDIAWYQNMGNNSFSTKIVIDSGNRSRDVITADIDGDGDMDILANFVRTGTNSDLVVYYKNDGNGGFGNMITLNDDSNRIDCVLPYDIDNDGDLDVFSTDLINDKVWMVENLGDGNFDDAKIIAEEVNGAQSLTIADYNNDGKNDIIVAVRNSASNISSFSYNNDGTFTVPVRISFVITNSQINTVYLNDLDLDGNLDLCLADDNSNNIAYLKNLGTSFSSSEVIVNPNATKASCVHAADLDADTDSEIIYTLNNGKEMGYYINSLLTSTTENIISNDIDIFPNPATNYIEVNMDINNIQQFTIYGINVIQQKQISNPTSTTINLETLSSGIYILHVKTSEGILTKQFVKS